ncbi:MULTISPECIES: class I SAM-dependent methyltransferase family protein [Haloferax]|uniref:Methyltransferase domain-containing protein n=1 Tax=Haloferax marinum TaxID=2666143 RepID=A0A6A8G5I3_9EURY|nr:MULTISPECIES: class I SAM-dependent methyltransferase family protein [Haloferax]KAB1196855.1 class I SAM-dependent methyltransferase family protein [Haloferax sp. CBA1150]MRW95868.1 methyltransferase domain-containing protein [Haloferax marinum]
MNVPCVRVPRESGEATRQRLADFDLLDHDHQITVVEGYLYIPVVSADDVPTEFDVVEYESPDRETQTTPTDILGYEPSYERLGDIVILDEDDPERAREIADAIVESDLKAATVVNRASKIKGELRVRDWDVLVGDSTETVHREYGTELRLDIDSVYFSPRLATERHRVVQQVREGEHVFDMFAGVGPFAVPAAKAGADVVACDLNEVAVEYLRENAERNDVTERLTAIHGDVRDVADEYDGWADRLIMNLPHSASEFLDTAVRLAGDECVVHLYDIQHEDDPFGPGLTAVRAAAEDEYDIEVLEEKIVRSYAPHEYNVCLDVRLTKRP